MALCALCMLAPTHLTADATARTGSGVRLATDTIEVASNELEAISLRFAQAVRTGSATEIQAFLAQGGIRLQLDGPAHTGISSRQAVASLREFLRGFDQTRTILSRASPVDGSPNRGFAEVLWSGRAAGTSDEVRRTLFIGLVRDAVDWRVDEVRMLP